MNQTQRRALTSMAVFVLASSFITTVWAESNSASVIGVSLGMPLIDAQQAAQENVPEMRFTEMNLDVGALWKSRIKGINYIGGFSAYTDYRSEAGNSKMMVMGHAPPNESQVSAIGRTSLLDEMSLTDFRSALIEKYGQPHFETKPGELRSIGGSLISWSLTKDGKPQTDVNTILACSRHGNKYAQDVVAFVNGLTFPEEQFYGQYKSCGFTLVVYAQQGQLPELVRSYNIILYNLNDIQKANAATLAMAEREAEKLDAQKIEDAKGKKPVL